MGFHFSRSERNQKSFSYFNIEDEKEEINNTLGLKIHICGNLPEKEKIIKDLFVNDITNKDYESRATHEFKTNQFYWIAKTYQDLSEGTIKLIIDEIKSDIDRPIKEKPIHQQVILCFGSENINLLFEEVINSGDIYIPLFIIISEKEIKEVKFNEKRKITNIILNDKTEDKLNSKIISILWEYDCYYNEKGNKICRYTPDNIFSSLNNNLSFYSINILLTGKSRAGKSTFINYLSNRLNALESSKKVSVSKKITEYCLYENNNNSEHSCIKLFDTPGIVPGKIEESINFLNDLLNKENNIERQIHFVLFFFMEGEPLEKIDEVCQILNDCQRPVLFIINKSLDTSDNGKSKDIKATINILNQKNFLKLINEDNFICINLVKSRRLVDYGVEDIFNRIHQIFIEKNKLNNDKDIKDLKEKFEKLYKEYKKIYEGPSEKIDINDKSGKKYKFQEKVNELKKELDKKYEMFNYIKINNIIETGEKSANKCRKVINSLSNISNVLKNINELDDIPAISYFQAFMVKEIGEIFGFNLKEINQEIKSYLDNIEKSISELELYSISDNKIKEKENKVEVSMDIIAKQLKNELENFNKDFIKKLANTFNRIRNEEINKKDMKENQINKSLTDGIYNECIKYKVKFDFCGTGNVFIKDGKTYNIPKAYQRVMALKSELQNPLIYKETDIKIQPRCKTCKRRNSCNGCRWCGKCN